MRRASLNKSTAFVLSCQVTNDRDQAFLPWPKQPDLPSYHPQKANEKIVSLHRVMASAPRLPVAWLQYGFNWQPLRQRWLKLRGSQSLNCYNILQPIHYYIQYYSEVRTSCF